MISLKNTLEAIGTKISAINSSLGNVPHRTLLWTNPSPLTDFAQQTVSLDLTNYDELQIVSVRNRDDGMSPLFSTTLNEKSLDFDLAVFKDVQFWRAANFNDNGVSFSNAYWLPRYQVWFGNMANNICIPYKIYGIKYGGV